MLSSPTALGASYLGPLALILSPASGCLNTSSTPTVQGALGCPQLLPAGWCRLRRHLQPGCQTGDNPHRPHHRRLTLLAHSSAGREEHLPPWESRGDGLLPVVIWLRQPGHPRLRLLDSSRCPGLGTSDLLATSAPSALLPPKSDASLFVYKEGQRGRSHRLPAPLRRRHYPHGVIS